MPWLCCGPKLARVSWAGRKGCCPLQIVGNVEGSELPSSIPPFHLSSLFLSFPSLSLCLSLIVSKVGYINTCLCSNGNEPKPWGQTILWETDRFQEGDLGEASCRSGLEV